MQPFHRSSIAFLFCLLIVLSLSSPLFAARHNEQSRTILILGDSLSAGYGIDLEQSWPQLLSQHLIQPSSSSQGLPDDKGDRLPSGKTDKAPERPSYSVVNASISGDTSAGGLRRLPALLSTHQPYLVVIELGGNDGLRGYPIANLRKNLSEMVRLSQAAGAKVVLAGMRIPPNYGLRYTQQFFDSYRLIATQYQTALIPFLLDGIALNPELMQRDGIHPNAEAQGLILQNVLPVLKPLL